MKNKSLLAIIFIVSLLIYIVLINVDAFELLVEWTRQYEQYEVDELLLFVPVYALAISILFGVNYLKLKKINKELEEEIANRKATEAKLKNSEYILANHLKNTPLAVVMWDLDYKITEWNHAAETLFGYKKSEVTGQDIMKLLFQENAQKLGKKIVQDLMDSQKGTKIAVKCNTNKNEPVTCRWFNTLLRNEYGRETGVASIINRTTLKEKK